MSTDGNTLTVQNAGYFEGVTDVYYALMTTKDGPSTAPAYATPVCAAKTIEIQVTPNYTEKKVYASNVATRRENRVESYTVNLNADQVIPAVRKVLLGREAGADGVEMIKGTNVAPWVAILFAITLDDDTKEYWCMYKGKFQEPTNTHHTKNDGDSYQHPQLQATFVRLESNDALAAVASEAGGSSQATDAWFNAVYQPSGQQT